jgi:hypothetical protein
MALLEKLLSDIKAAMKAGDREKLGTLRFLHAKIKDEAINRGDRKDITDEGFIAVCAANIKSRQDSVEQYRKGGREDLAAKEEKEIAVIRAYMPSALSASELEQLVREAVAESGAKEPKDMGSVMKILMPKIKGRADGAAVSGAVKKLLAPPPPPPPPPPAAG